MARIVSILTALILLACGPAGLDRRSPYSPKLIQKAGDGVLLPLPAAKFLEAEIALLEGDAGRAADAYSTALTMDPDNLMLMTSLAKAHRAGGNRARARELLDRVLLVDPAYEPALTLMAALCQDAGDTPRAEDFLKRAIAAAPDSADGYLALARLYRGAGNLDAALETTETLISRDPANADACGLSAELAFDLGRLELSQERALDFIQAVPLEERGTAYGLLLKQGRKMLEAGREDYALMLFAAYRSVFPDDGAAIEGSVACLLGLGRIDEARAVISGIKEDALLLKAQLYYEAGDYLAGLKIVETLFPPGGGADQPAPAKVIRTVGRAFELNVDAARQGLDSFAEDEMEGRAEALGKAFVLLSGAGLRDQAWSLWLDDPAMPRSVETFEIFDAVARALADAPAGGSETAGVTPKLEAFTAGNLLLRWSGLLAGNADETQWLADHIEEEIAGAPSAELRRTGRIVKAILLGEKLLKANQTELLNLVVKLKEENPADPAVPSLQGRFFFLVGNPDRALPWLEKAQARRPGDDLTSLWLAELLLSSQKPQAAASILKHALMSRPPLYLTKRILALMK